MEVIEMTAAHVEQIAKLERLCFSAPWSEASIRSELQNPLSKWFVAVKEDEVVGYIGSQSVMGEADMMNLAVSEGFRQQGIGKQLVKALELSLYREGITSITLEVRPSNNPAIRLYQNLGFEQVGCRPNYYTKPREDALILRKELGA